MASEGFGDDEWDPDFIDMLVQAEELALSTQLPENHHPPPPPPPPPQPPPQPQHSGSRPLDVSYSPPRELSQRSHDKGQTGGIPDCFDSFPPRVTDFAKEPEIDRLKRDLDRTLKQLRDREKENLELRKERDKEKQQLKVKHPKTEAKDAEFHQTTNTEIPAAPGISTDSRSENLSDKQFDSWKKSYDRGVQTDNNTEFSTSDLRNVCCSSKKLFDLWKSDADKLGSALVVDLFVTCEANFHVLFGYLKAPQVDSNMTLLDQPCPTQPIGCAKVSHLYSVLTKLSNGTLKLEDLLEALVDLCSLKNVVIVHNSLCVLHKILKNPLSMEMEKKIGKRENVIIEETVSEKTKTDADRRGNPEEQSLCFANIAEILKQGQVPSALKFSNVKTPGACRFFDRSFRAPISKVHWVSIFERVCLIPAQNNDKQIWSEALSVMNLIIMRQNAFKERDKFAGELVFGSLSQLLRKEAGFSVQDQAVHTLFLLCNCPKVIPMLCSGLKEDGEPACPEGINDKNTSTLQGFNDILIGLADCVAFSGSATTEEMKLRKNAINFLAFLGSSGKFGFEVLLDHKLPKGTNFLAIILQSLIYDLDLQASKSAKNSGIIHEQSLLTREALIFFNRLASHPEYSLSVLQALTNTREMASAAVDLANRLTHKGKLPCQDKNSTKQITEIMELARIFKKRVFTFLGDSIP